MTSRRAVKLGTGPRPAGSGKQRTSSQVDGDQTDPKKKKTDDDADVGL